MGTKSKEMPDIPKLLKMMTRMAKQIEKLEDMSGTVAVLKNQISDQESESVKKISVSEFPGYSGNISTKKEIDKMEFETDKPNNETDNSKIEADNMNNEANEVILRDQRIAELESQVFHLESPEHRENLILEWLNNLDQESYYALGVRKGYLEEINPPAEKTTPGELREPDPEVQFSREKPEDPTGWAYSQTLKGYIRIVEAFSE